MTIDKAVRTLRAYLGKSQQVFATELCISMAALRNYEKGQHQPQAKALFAFHKTALLAGRQDLAEYFFLAAVESLNLDDIGSRPVVARLEEETRIIGMNTRRTTQ